MRVRGLMRGVGVCALALVATCTLYQPGALLTGDNGVRYGNAFTVGCLDLTVIVRCDPELRPGAVLVMVDFGNRCDRSVPLDFTRLAVFEGSALDGRRMLPFDPNGEIVPGRVVAHAISSERIEYDRLVADVTPPRRVCVLATPMADATLPATPLCFDAQAEGLCPMYLSAEAQ